MTHSPQRRRRDPLLTPPIQALLPRRLRSSQGDCEGGEDLQQGVRMKSAQRAAMRQKARSKWGCFDDLDEAEQFEDAVGWQDTRMKTWCPTPQETGNTPEYFAANPSLPF